MKSCNQCGKCCTQYSHGGLSATGSEINLWELFNPEIAEYVHDGKIWVDPTTRQTLPICPWLRKVPHQEKYTCDIYFDRPDDCKHYPVTIEQMIHDECEMLEIRDLKNPKKAQRDLDALMEDSRPPCKG